MLYSDDDDGERLFSDENDVDEDTPDQPNSPEIISQRPR